MLGRLGMNAQMMTSFDPKRKCAVFLNTIFFLSKESYLLVTTISSLFQGVRYLRRAKDWELISFSLTPKLWEPVIHWNVNHFSSKPMPKIILRIAFSTEDCFLANSWWLTIVFTSIFQETRMLSRGWVRVWTAIGNRNVSWPLVRGTKKSRAALHSHYE